MGGEEVGWRGLNGPTVNLGRGKLGCRRKRKRADQMGAMKEREPADWAKRRRGKRDWEEKVRVGCRTFELLILKTTDINQKPRNEYECNIHIHFI
jgi:hypothetical protein